MAEIMAWPLNLTAYSYNAQDVMRFMAGKTSGVFGEEGNFQVIAKSGMTVTVQAEGKTGGWLSDGAKYGVSFWSEDNIDLTVETADGVNPRKDRVIVSWRIPQQTTVPDVLIRKGTPSANPQPPALVNNGEYAEICLAEINVPAGATEITSYNITDTRLDESLCGLVSMGVEKIPTDGLEAQFMGWFEDLQTNLDGDVAYNLQSQITTHINDTAVHLRQLTHSKSGTTHALTGLSGVSGTVSCVFKATAAYAAGDTITVDGTAYAIQLSNGEAAEDNLFVSGVSVPVVIDTAGKKVNFKAGGGLTNVKLALATALVSDVAQGKTFYAGDKTLKTGTALVTKFASGTIPFPGYGGTATITLGWRPKYVFIQVTQKTKNGHYSALSYIDGVTTGYCFSHGGGKYFENESSVVRAGIVTPTDTGFKAYNDGLKANFGSPTTNYVYFFDDADPSILYWAFG